MVWTAIWDAQNGLIQIWRTGGELTHKNDQIHVWFGQPSGLPRLPDPDLAVKLGAYERIGELPGAARSAATGSERQLSLI